MKTLKSILAVALCAVGLSASALPPSPYRDIWSSTPDPQAIKDPTDVIDWCMSSRTFESPEAKHGKFLEASADAMIAAYSARIAKDDTDYEAYICRAFAYLKKVGENQEFFDLAQEFGYTFDNDTMHFTGELIQKKGVTPEMNEATAKVCDILLPLMKAAYADLVAIPYNWKGSVAITPDVYPVDDEVYFDWADVLCAKMGLAEMMCVLNMVKGFDMTMDSDLLEYTFNSRSPKNGKRGVQPVLENNPDFFSKVRDQKAATEAGDWWASATTLLDQWDKAHTKRSDGKQHFFDWNFEKMDDNTVQCYDWLHAHRDGLINLPYWASPFDYTLMNGDTVQFWTLQPLFAGKFLRKHFPEFGVGVKEPWCNEPMLDTLPDSTLCGIYPGVSRTYIGNLMTQVARAGDFTTIPPYTPDSASSMHAIWYDNMFELGFDNTGNQAIFAWEMQSPLVLLDPEFNVRGVTAVFTGWSFSGYPNGTKSEWEGKEIPTPYTKESPMYKRRNVVATANFTIPQVTYLDFEGGKLSERTDECEIVKAETTTFEAGKVYTVVRDITIANRITVSGTSANPTKLVLCDGVTLSVANGIEVAAGSALIICGQALGTGILEATGSSGAAGIGGGGIVTINGGTVIATGGSSGSGIGGGTVTINAGTVTAAGRDGAAGIAGTVKFADGTAYGVAAGADEANALYMTAAAYATDHSAAYVALPCFSLKIPEATEGYSYEVSYLGLESKAALADGVNTYAIATGATARVLFTPGEDYVWVKEPVDNPMIIANISGDTVVGAADLPTTKFVKKGSAGNPWAVGYSTRDSVAAWTNGTDKLVVEGAGNMDDFTEGNPAPWGTGITEVEIGEDVTSIGANAFNDSRLGSVTIPASVTSIGAAAFFGSTSLSNVTVEAMTPPALGEEAFVELAEGYKIIVPMGTGAAYKAAPGWSLYADSIFEQGSPECPWEIGKTAGDSVIAYLDGDGKLVIEGEGDMKDFDPPSDPAPWGKGITEVEIGDGVTGIGANAFNDSQLGRVTIPASVTNIGAAAFFGSTSLSNVTVEAMTPPALGADAFVELAEGFKIAVPMGTGAAYKAAPDWSLYADSIFEQGSPECPWEIGEGVEAYLNGTELVIQGAGTISDLSKIPDDVKSGIDGITITTSDVTGAASDAFAGFDGIALTLPEGWQGDRPDAGGNWYGATGVAIAGSEYCPWTIGEGVTAYTNGTELVISGTGTITDLSKIPDYIKNVIDGITITTSDVTGAASDAFAGFDDIALTLPVGWQGDRPDADGNWYGATGAAIAGSEDCPWTIGTDGETPPQNVTAYTNDTELVIQGAGTISDLSKISDDVKSGIDAITITTNGVTGAEAEAFAGIGGGSEVKVTLPENWQGELPDADGKLYGMKVDMSNFMIPRAVKNVKFLQRYPWNGKVDIGFGVTGPEGEKDVAVTVRNGETEVTNFTAAVTVPAGGALATNLVWDATTAGLAADFKSDAVTVEVALVENAPNGPVQLWENGPYFAACNVGANAPQEYGYYFWWGDTKGYVRNGNSWDAADESETGFSFASENCPTYGKTIEQLYNEGNGYIDANSADGKLKPAYDAATAHLGAPWRMMTKDELELLTNTAYCVSVWTDDYNETGVAGQIVTGVTEGYTDKSIFLPAAGDGDNLAFIGANMLGFFWSSTPSSDNSDCACTLNLLQGDFKASRCSRGVGASVRPVRDTPPEVAPAESAISAKSAAGTVDLRTSVELVDGETTISNVTWSATLWGELDEEFVTAIGWTNLMTGATGVFSNLARVVGDAAEDVDLPKKDGDYVLTHSTGDLKSFVTFLLSGTGNPVGSKGNPWVVAKTADDSVAAYTNGVGGVVVVGEGDMRDFGPSGDPVPWGTDVTEVEIGGNVTGIGANAFKDSTSLTNVTVLANTPPAMGADAFSGCDAIETVNVPKGTGEVYKAAPGWSDFADKIIEQGTPENPWKVGDGVTAYIDDDGALHVDGDGAMTDFSDDYPAPWATSVPPVSSAEIGEDVTGVGANAFNGCSSLTNVTVKATVPPSLGADAFSGCDNLENILVPWTTGDDYRGASGWEDYADKILEMPGSPENPWKVGTEGDPDGVVAWTDGEGTVYFKPPRSDVSREGLETITNALGGADFDVALVDADGAATNDVKLIVGASGKQYMTLDDMLASDDDSFKFFDVTGCTVNYNGNGAVGEMESETFLPGVPTKLAANAFTAAGYEFQGWTTNGASGKIVFEDQAEIADPQPGVTYDLKAVWTPVPTTVGNYDDLKKVLDQAAKIGKPVEIVLDGTITPPAGEALVLPSTVDVEFSGDGKIGGLVFKDGVDWFADSIAEHSDVFAYVDPAVTSLAAFVIDNGLPEENRPVDLDALTDAMEKAGYVPAVTPFNALVVTDDGAVAMPAKWIDASTGTPYANLEAAVNYGVKSVTPDFGTEEDPIPPRMIVKEVEAAPGVTLIATMKNAGGNVSGAIQTLDVEGISELVQTSATSVELDVTAMADLESSELLLEAATEAMGGRKATDINPHYVDISLSSVGTDGAKTPIHELSEPLAIVIPWTFEDHHEYKAVRYHDGATKVFAEAADADGEYVEFDKTNGRIVIHSKLFSDFAVIDFEMATVDVSLPAGLPGVTYVVSNLTEGVEIPATSSQPGGAVYALPIGSTVAIYAIPSNGYKISGETTLVIEEVQPDTTIEVSDLPQVERYCEGLCSWVNLYGANPDSATIVYDFSASLKTTVGKKSRDTNQKVRLGLNSSRTALWYDDPCLAGGAYDGVPGVVTVDKKGNRKLNVKNLTEDQKLQLAADLIDYADIGTGVKSAGRWCAEFVFVIPANCYRVAGSRKIKATYLFGDCCSDSVAGRFVDISKNSSRLPDFETMLLNCFGAATRAKATKVEVMATIDGYDPLMAPIKLMLAGQGTVAMLKDSRKQSAEGVKSVTGTIVGVMPGPVCENCCTVGEPALVFDCTTGQPIDVSDPADDKTAVFGSFSMKYNQKMSVFPAR